MSRRDAAPNPETKPLAHFSKWQIPAALIAIATAICMILEFKVSRISVAVVGALATIVMAAMGNEVGRRGERIRRMRDDIARRDDRVAQQTEETAHLATTLLPEVVDRLRKGEFPQDVLASVRASQPHQAVVRSVVDAVIAEEDLRESAQRAFVNIARRVQAIVHQQAQELREMEDRHGKTPDVFGDLLRLDHGTALIGRLADSIAVLGGARPGRQWSRAVPLYSVMRGAMSRIIDYQRVELHAVTEVAITGPAVEPLIHALAELLDNATRYSPPQTKVHVTAIDVQSGIAVEIEDGGVSMSDEARKRAERMLRQAQQGLDLNDLGETPRLGLAVIGRLAQAYGFRVSLRSSAYGGVRAVLVIPMELVTTVATATGLAHGIGASSASDTANAPEGAARSTRLTSFDQAPTHQGEQHGQGPVGPDLGAPAIGRTTTGLPKRRRRSPAPSESGPFAATTASAEEPTPQVQPGIWLAAFQSGLSGEQADVSKGNTQQ